VPPRPQLLARVSCHGLSSPLIPISQAASPASGLPTPATPPPSVVVWRERP
jgi:hypothetical protein